jgi:hypothetical protein
MSSICSSQEQEGGMIVKLGDNATYIVRGVGSICFYMTLGNVIELRNILLVPILRKTILLVSCMIYV